MEAPDPYMWPVGVKEGFPEEEPGPLGLEFRVEVSGRVADRPNTGWGLWTTSRQQHLPSPKGPAGWALLSYLTGQGERHRQVEWLVHGYMAGKRHWDCSPGK